MRVRRGSRADREGMRAGDVVVEIDGGGLDEYTARELYSLLADERFRTCRIVRDATVLGFDFTRLR